MEVRDTPANLPARPQPAGAWAALLTASPIASNPAPSSETGQGTSETEQDFKQKLFTTTVVIVVAQRGCGCPVPGDVHGQVGWALGNLI